MSWSLAAIDEAQGPHHYALQVAPAEKIMIELGNSEHRAKTREESYRGSATAGRDVWAVAGRTAYREEFHPNYGPDSDERPDATESGNEF